MGARRAGRVGGRPGTGLPLGRLRRLPRLLGRQRKPLCRLALFGCQPRWRLRGTHRGAASALPGRSVRHRPRRCRATGVRRRHHLCRIEEGRCAAARATHRRHRRRRPGADGLAGAAPDGWPWRGGAGHRPGQARSGAALRCAGRHRPGGRRRRCPGAPGRGRAATVRAGPGGRRGHGVAGHQVAGQRRTAATGRASGRRPVAAVADAGHQGCGAAGLLCQATWPSCSNWSRWCAHTACLHCRWTGVRCRQRTRRWTICGLDR